MGAKQRVERLERAQTPMLMELWTDCGDGWAEDGNGQRVRLAELDHRRAVVVLITEEVVSGEPTKTN